MATDYDEWKATETFSDEAEFVARRRDELVREWVTDKAKVTEAIADALSDDGNDFFAETMARLVISVDLASEDNEVAIAGFKFWNAVSPMVMERIKRDAETAAQAEYDSRLTGPEGDL